MLRSKGRAREDSRFEKPDIPMPIREDLTVNVNDIDRLKLQSTLIFYRERIIFEKRDGRKWSSKIRIELKKMCEKHELYNFQDISILKI